jgi:gamma-glutamylcyclotransferase (GGCT)/AIG2-like uncharacterized protein YtfP
MQHLFVYGTLAPGRANHKILEHISGSWQEATLRGTLHQEGWGVRMGYPGITPSKNGDKVEGFVFSSKELTNNWSMLDKFEGDGYKRMEVSVTLKKGIKMNAYVYALSRNA